MLYACIKFDKLNNYICGQILSHAHIHTHIFIRSSMTCEEIAGKGGQRNPAIAFLVALVDEVCNRDTTELSHCVERMRILKLFAAEQMRILKSFAAEQMSIFK